MILGGRISLINIDLKVFRDIFLADNLITRYSTRGYIIFLTGGLVYKKSKQ